MLATVTTIDRLCSGKSSVVDRSFEIDGGVAPGAFGDVSGLIYISPGGGEEGIIIAAAPTDRPAGRRANPQLLFPRPFARVRLDNNRRDVWARHALRECASVHGIGYR